MNALEKLSRGAVIPAVPLVLDNNRQFHESGQKRLIRYYLESGCGGVAAGVHTTQFEIRQHGLFECVMNSVVQEINHFEKKTNGVVVKVAGVCGEIAQAVREANFLKSIGYDAVLLSPGGLSHLSEDVLLERTKIIADIMPVIGFYLQPAAGGRLHSFEYWKKLVEIDNVIAIKCASFNRYQTLDVMRAVALSGRADQIAMYTGNDDNIVIDLLTKYQFTVDEKVYEKRFVGGLLGHWAVWTSRVVELFEQIKEESEKSHVSVEMLNLANQITDCNAAFFDVQNQFAGCIPGIHEVLRRQGLLENILCLNPEEQLSEGQKEEIDRVYRMYPHLNDDAFASKFLSCN